MKVFDCLRDGYCVLWRPAVASVMVVPINVSFVLHGKPFLSSAQECSHSHAPLQLSLTTIGVFVMQSTDENKKRKMKQSRLPSPKMPVTDLTDVQNFDDSVFFPIEEIVQYPLPGCVVPSSISFSPDDNFIAYLFSPDQTLNKKVFSVDLKTSEPDLIFSPPDGGLDESNISPEEKLRRERLRERGLGVTQYEWMKTTNSKKKAIMVPLPAGIYIHDIYYSETKLKLPSIPSSPIIDPHLSPDGSMLAYVRDSELHALDMFSNELKQLTHGAKESGLTHGLAEYIAQEEMDRKTGYWWSPDSKHIAFTEVDYSGIPLFRIMHEGKSSVGLEAQEDHPYPFAGASNAKVRLGVVSVAEGSTTWMDLQCGGMDQHNNEEEYLARVNWIHGNILIAQELPSFLGDLSGLVKKQDLGIFIFMM
ncbi:hypothetical protein K1719_025892 [Acacia pycnantha]|nr:hypothetical protein K1719_025892 [Acacia pycnantha]